MHKAANTLKLEPKRYKRGKFPLISLFSALIWYFAILRTLENQSYKLFMKNIDKTALKPPSKTPKSPAFITLKRTQIIVHIVLHIF